MVSSWHGSTTSTDTTFKSLLSRSHDHQLPVDAGTNADEDDICVQCISRKHANTCNVVYFVYFMLSLMAQELYMYIVYITNRDFLHLYMTCLCTLYSLSIRGMYVYFYMYLIHVPHTVSYLIGFILIKH